MQIYNILVIYASSFTLIRQLFAPIAPRSQRGDPAALVETRFMLVCGACARSVPRDAAPGLPGQARAAHTPRQREHPVRALPQLPPYYRQYALLRYEKLPLRQHLQSVVEPQPLHLRPVIIPPAQRLIPQPYQLLVPALTHNTTEKHLTNTKIQKNRRTF